MMYGYVYLFDINPMKSVVLHTKHSLVIIKTSSIPCNDESVGFGLIHEI